MPIAGELYAALDLPATRYILQIIQGASLPENQFPGEAWINEGFTALVSANPLSGSKRAQEVDKVLLFARRQLCAVCR